MVIAFCLMNLSLYTILMILGLFIIKEENDRRLLVKLALIPLIVSIILTIILQSRNSYIILLGILSITISTLIIMKD